MAEALRERRDGLTVRRRADDQPRTTEGRQLLGPVLRVGVHEVMRPEAPGEILLVLASREHADAQAELGCPLRREVTEAAQAVNRDEIAALRATALDRGEGCAAGAQKRGGFDRPKLIRNRDERF